MQSYLSYNKTIVIKKKIFLFPYYSYFLYFRNENGLILKCLDCDKDVEKIKINRIFECEKYLKHIGLNFLNVLMLDETTLVEKAKFVSSFNRYILHITEIKSTEIFHNMTEFIVNLNFQIDFPLSSVLQCLVYNSKKDFDLERVKYILQNIEKNIKRNKYCSNQKCKGHIVDFLINLGR